MKKKWLLSVFLLLLVFLIAACSGDEESKEGSDTSEENSETIPGAEQGEMPEPDLEGIPDVVAEINGEEISKEEFSSVYTSQFSQVMMQAQMSGQEVDQEQLKGQTVEGLIDQKLIIQEAENSGFEAEEDEMNEIINMLVQQSGLESEEAFFTALNEQGMEEEEVMSQVETQVKVDKLIASKSDDAEPSEEELQEMYDMYTAQLEQMNGEAGEGEEMEVPSFEEMESELVAQAKAVKESEAYQTIIEELRADAEITNHL